MRSLQNAVCSIGRKVNWTFQPSGESWQPLPFRAGYTVTRLPECGKLSASVVRRRSPDAPDSPGRF